MTEPAEPLDEPLTARKAKELVRKILVEGMASYTDHALAEMKKDKMTTVDCENILRGGIVDEAEFENGAWRTPRSDAGAGTRGGAGHRDRMEEAMRCRECSKPMEVKKVAAYPYLESGLSNVVLRGILVRRCPAGHKVVSIPQMSGLHLTLAMWVAKQRARLRGEQVRFLRKYLGLSGVDFARTLDVAPETVSRWEHDRERMSVSLERFLRLIVIHGARVEEYPIDQLAEVAREDEKPPKEVAVAVGVKGWEATAA